MTDIVEQRCNLEHAISRAEARGYDTAGMRAMLAELPWRRPKSSEEKTRERLLRLRLLLVEQGMTLFDELDDRLPIGAVVVRPPEGSQVLRAYVRTAHAGSPWYVFDSTENGVFPHPRRPEADAIIGIVNDVLRHLRTYQVEPW